MQLPRVFAGLVFGSLLLWTACGGGPGVCSGGAGNGSGQTGGSSSGSSGGPGDNVCGTSGGGGGGNNGGGGGGGSNYNALIYYAPETSNTIQAAGLSASILAPLSVTTPTQAVNAQMIFVNKQFLYAAVGTGVEGYLLDRTTGTLTNVLGNLASYPAQGNLVAADPLGRFLFVSGGGSSIYVFQINSGTGTLVAAPSSPFGSNLLQIAQLTADASGKFLYASDGSSMTAIYSVDQSTGALTSVTGSPLSLGVGCIQASLGGEFLLGIPSCFGLGSQGLHVFSINATTGIPTEISGSPFSTTASVFNFAISPTGQFVYSFGYTSGSSSTVAPIEGFQMDASTGSLSAMFGSPFISLPTVVNCFFDQSGAYMLCGDTLRVANFYVVAVDPKAGTPSLQATFPPNSANPIDVMYTITD